MNTDCEFISKLNESIANKLFVLAFGSKSWTILFSTFKSCESLGKSRGHQSDRNPVISTKNRGLLVINPLATMTNQGHFVFDALALMTNQCRFVNDPVRLNTKPCCFITDHVVGTIKRRGFNIKQITWRGKQHIVKPNKIKDF